MSKDESVAYLPILPSSNNATSHPQCPYTPLVSNTAMTSEALDLVICLHSVSAIIEWCSLWWFHTLRAVYDHRSIPIHWIPVAVGPSEFHWLILQSLIWCRESLNLLPNPWTVQDSGWNREFNWNFIQTPYQKNRFSGQRPDESVHPKTASDTKRSRWEYKIGVQRR